MTHQHREHSFQDGMITAVAVGGFLIILGAIFGLTPGMPEKLIDFFTDFTGQSYPFGDGAIVLPAPAHPALHIDVYAAVFNFMIGIAILQIVILALRVSFHSTVGRIAESVGDLIFWFGAALVANIFLLTGTLDGWFTFWAALIIVLGVSLIVRGIIHFSRGRRGDSRQCC